MAECKKCYWAQKGMMSGQAFRPFTCEICGRIEMHANTNVPRICAECSRRLNICERCLGDLDEGTK